MKNYMCSLLLLLIALFIPSCHDYTVPVSLTEYYDSLLSPTDIDGKIEYRKIMLPDTLKGYKASYTKLYDKSTLLTCLYDEKTYLDKEYGFYNFDTGEYQFLFSLPENLSSGVCAINENYIILKFFGLNAQFLPDSQSSSSVAEGIYAYSLHENHLFCVHLFSIDSESKQVEYENYNDVLLLGDTLWFDDFYANDSGKILVDLYCTDLKDLKPQKIEENAQNPFYYKNQVHFFVHDENWEYKVFCSLDGQTTKVSAEDLKGIAPFQDNFYCIEHKPDYKELLYRFIIKDMSTDKILASCNSSNIVASLKATDFFVSWNNYADHVPCIYDRKTQKILVFSNLPEGNNRFLIKENYGILFQLLPGYQSKDIYFFERKK
ncbi:hypothetical protein EII17_08035 [Clostridiales bacterium COT073_COT-073]|nr:hypothetical protein EII17_08035 [Clostridiales bacterium COT073_COT-073]